MIKNLSGQEFADFDAWKEWAKNDSNINPLVVKFLTFYPWIITEKDGAQASEEFSNKLEEQFIAYSYDSLIRKYECKDLEPLGYEWYEYFYNFSAMKLIPNGDGTYTLANVHFRASDNLHIPECVSRIECNALEGVGIKSLTFPKNFASTSPIYITLHQSSYSWSSDYVYTVFTRHPLNIEFDQKKSDNLKNGYYSDLLYTTFRRLCSVWPSAFEGENSPFDDMVFLREGGHLRRISNDSVYAAYSASNALQLHDVTLPIPSKSDEVPLEECKVVAMEILPKEYGEHFESNIITVPESVEVLIVRRKIKELIILGNPKYVYLDEVPDKIKVNAKITEVRSQTLKEAYREYGYKRVVFNLPDLCGEESVNAGYIRVTAADVGRYDGCDRVVEINTDHIVLMSPETIFHRDRPVGGTRVYLAWNGNEQSFLSVLAYEPMDMIAEKLNKARK
jgi:hypothetical protein